MQAGLTPTVPIAQQLMELQIAAAERLYLKKPPKHRELSAAVKPLTHV